ncbi:hypothetical protein ATCC90586_005870 [Pythium insidiosum]|nr:hypothetical protein ATCC90586_005870 [Pythium insidiosum]
MNSTRRATMVLAAAALLLAAQVVLAQSNRLEVMLLTSWGDSLVRVDGNQFTYGLKFGRRDSTSPDQKWIIDDSTNTIRSLDNFCVSAVNDWDGGKRFPILMTRCGGPPNDLQRWVRQPEGTFQLARWRDGRRYNFCLDADPTTGGLVHAYECASPSNSNSNQLWTIFYPGYQIKAGGRCLALRADNTNREPVEVKGCENTPLQMWKYDFENARLRLGDPASKMCVDSWPVGESGVAHVWECTDGVENQQIEFKLKNVNGAGSISGQFFLRDTDNCLTINEAESKIGTTSCAQATIFELGTDLPGDLCGSKNCQNGGTCVFGRCRCPEGTFGNECEEVGQRIRIRASNGLVLTVDNSKYGLEFALLDGLNHQQVWMYYPKSGLVKAQGRRMCIKAEWDHLILDVCRSNDANQMWDYDVSSGRFKLRNGNGCIDINLGAGIVATAARFYKCDAKSNANQIVEMMAPDLPSFNSDMFASMIRHRVKSNLCWTVSGDKKQILPTPCKASADQLWMFNDAYTGVGLAAIQSIEFESMDAHELPFRALVCDKVTETILSCKT